MAHDPAQAGGTPFVRLPEPAELRAAGHGPNPRYDFGFVPGMTRLMWAHDTIGPKLAALFREVMFAPGRLTRAEREMLAAVAAAAQACEY